MHTGMVPRLGGISFVPSILVSVLFIIGISLEFGGIDVVIVVGLKLVPMLFMFCSLLLLFLVGIADDMIGVRYGAKFLVQMLASILLIMGGIWVQNLWGLFGIEAIPEWIGYLLTVFVVVYIVNAFNLIDGIDGLASGLSLIGLMFYGMYLYLEGEYLYAIVAWSAFGSLLPFIYFNLFGKTAEHKKIFMGDTGSLTIGLIVAFLVLAILSDASPEIGGIGDSPVLWAFSPIVVPLLDVARVALHRIVKKRNPFNADTCHIHHKLLALGYSQRQSLGIILTGDVCFLVLNLLLSGLLGEWWILALDVVIWIVLNLLLTRGIRLRERREGVKLYD